MISLSDFKKIKLLEEDEINPQNLKVGDLFLHGRNMSEQLNIKKEGDDVSYYKVINIKDNGNMLYTLIIDKIGGSTKNDS